MEDAAKFLFNSINSIKDVSRLINEGESENLFLECKSPDQPFNRDLQAQLSKAISGFSNTNGGVIFWGVSTDKKLKNGLDVLTQIEPIGACKRFSSEILNKMPILSNPTIDNYENKIIKNKETDTKGIVLTYIPATKGDPIQSTIDDHYYYRSGDEFIKTPHQMLKKLFASSDSPDLTAFISADIVKREENGFWNIPITISNSSSAIAEHVKMNVMIENPEVCSEFNSSGMKDISGYNPGSQIFSSDINTVIHKGLNIIAGNLKVKMVGNKKKVILKINIFANKMRAKNQIIIVKLYKNKFTTEQIKLGYLY